MRQGVAATDRGYFFTFQRHEYAVCREFACEAEPEPYIVSSDSKGAVDLEDQNHALALSGIARIGHVKASIDGIHNG